MNLQTLVLRYRQVAIFCLQIVFVLIGYVAAFYLRFDLDLPQAHRSTLFQTLPLLLACRLSAYYLYRLNSGWWRFVGMVDLVNITKAVLIGSILFVLGLVFIYEMEGYPRSVIIIELLSNFVLIGGVRFSVRWFRETVKEYAPKQLKDVLIVGAGKAGTKLLQEIRIHPHLGIRVKGFIDDDLKKKNAVIQGVKVLGKCDDISELASKLDLDEVIITIPCAGYKKISSIVQLAKQSGIKAKVLPSMAELIDRDGLWNKLREVPYDELLGRPVLKFRRDSDLELLRCEIEGKSVMVTGAAGSIGSELVRQTAKLNPRVLILYDRNETDLYYLERELDGLRPECRFVPVVGDILNGWKFNHLISYHRVNLIYHAAAYKHVPMMEREPFEAIKNNVLATRAVAEAAITYHVDKCVYISTDKAVKPSNLMGATKRIGEMVMQAYSQNGTKFITVRFGNVIGSSGSVVPIFQRQIAQGGPITVTHPEATRYFMSITEAVQLVMTAGAMGEGEEVFVLDMGKPIKILDLADRLIKSSALVPGKDIEIKFVGLRPGEKLHEELYWWGENIVPTTNKKITKLQSNNINKKQFLEQLNRLEQIEQEKNYQEVLKTLKGLVPEYSNGNRYEGGNEQLLNEAALESNPGMLVHAGFVSD